MTPSASLPPLRCSVSRRDFLKATLATSSIAAVAPSVFAEVAAKRPAPFVGIHIAAHSFHDEGIEYCLDLLQRDAAVTAPMVSCYGYYGAMGRPLAQMADHGVPRKDNTRRKLPLVWVRHHEKYFTDTALRHPAPNADGEFAGRDVLAELAEPVRKRGMKLYIRIYEPGGETALKNIANWDKVRERDFDGQPLGKPCLNHPDYRAWTVGSVRDLFENYPLDGLQFGAERCGPLGGILIFGERRGCFCEFCRARAKDKGIDFDRARRGMGEMHRYLDGLRQGGAAPADGPLTGYLRLLLNYPELLAWERQWHLANGEVHQLVHDAIKRIRPDAEVGRHVSHVESGWDPFYRAGDPYDEMPASCDFIKMIVYHEIAGPRLRNWFLNPVGKTLLRDLPPDQLLAAFYALYGHDPKQEPSLANLDDGLSPEYVFRETKRCVDAVAGKSRVYSGIGLDIPKGGGWGTEPWPSDPDKLHRAVRRAFDAGAAGIVISREYEENRLDSLKIVGRAVREASES